MSPSSDDSGSSPLTRGKPEEMNQLADRGRLIPAHAGKTSRPAKPCPHLPAHPRSRGENLLFDNVGKELPGSSPLTRGKRCRQPSTPHFRAAHPRSRGENGGVNSASEPLEGSSPLTRGKRTRSITRSLTTRLIPAHAGKTQRWPPTTRSRAAHPRSRGENVDDLGFVLGRRGSSPLTRGKPSTKTRRNPTMRLIPAHAGKTRPVICSHRAIAAHPRSRGENASSVS